MIALIQQGRCKGYNIKVSSPTMSCEVFQIPIKSLIGRVPYDVICVVPMRLAELDS